MIFTLESFHVERKDHAEFVNISEERIWPDLEKNGARPIGLWSVVLGGPEEILAMTRYDSLAQWQETRSWERLSVEPLAETLERCGEVGDVRTG